MRNAFREYVWAVESQDSPPFFMIHYLQNSENIIFAKKTMWRIIRKWFFRKFLSYIDRYESEEDKWVCFILMAHTDKINRLCSSNGFIVQITSDERLKYRMNGRISANLMRQARIFRNRFPSQIHKILKTDEEIILKDRINGYYPAFDIQWMQIAKEKVSQWRKTEEGVPFHYLFDYHPANVEYMDEYAVDEIQSNRQMLWNFKNNNEWANPNRHVRALYDAVLPLAEHIKNTWGKDATKLTLFCIPASTLEGQWLRYREFSRMLCVRTGMEDSFHHVQISEDKQPAHLGGEKKINFKLDASYFYGKAILVFDDVLTTGKSLHTCKGLLEKEGAKVIAACFLGQTVKK